MRATLLILVLTGCSAGASSLLDPPPVPVDAGTLFGDAEPADSPPSDAGGLDAATQDLGVPADCRSWSEQVLTRDALPDVAPSLFGNQDELAIAWRSASGVEVAVLDLRLNVRSRFRIDAPIARDLYVYYRAFEHHVVWVENDGDLATIIDRNLELETEWSVSLGAVGLTRIATLLGRNGQTVVFAASTSAASVHYLGAAGLGSLSDAYLDQPLRSDNAGPAAPIAIAPSYDGIYLAWLAASGIRIRELRPGGPPNATWALVPPEETLQPGFVFDSYSIPGEGEVRRGISVVAASGSERAGRVHRWTTGQGDQAIRDSDQRRTTGALAAVRMLDRGAYALAWSDQRDGREQLLGNLVDTNGRWMVEEDLVLSDPALQSPPRAPVLHSLGGSRVALAYLTEDQELHLAAGTLECQPRVPARP